MVPRVTEIRPRPDFTLVLTFTNHEVRVFDVKPYLDRGIFRELNDPGYFNAVRPFWAASSGPTGRTFARIRCITKAHQYKVINDWRRLVLPNV